MDAEVSEGEISEIADEAAVAQRDAQLLERVIVPDGESHEGLCRVCLCKACRIWQEPSL